MTPSPPREDRIRGPRLRQSRITELVREQGQVSVEGLAERFGASHETIRRDLSSLAENGVVQKVHGGAKLPRLREEDSFHRRMDHQSAAKRIIAGKLGRRISSGETLFLNTGTTTVIAAEVLAEIDRLTVLTNSYRIARTFTQKAREAEVFLVGGRFDGDNGETLGPMAIADIQRFHADHAILTVAAVDANQGAMDANFEEAQVARGMIEQADNLIVLADSSKFDRRAAFAVCPLEQINCLLSDSPPEGALLDRLERLSVAF